MTKITGAMVILAYVGWVSSASSAPINDFVGLDGNQWAQPDDFVGLSWNDIFNVCGAGSCAGTLTSDSGTWDMDGWT